MSPQEFEYWILAKTTGDDGWILVAHPDWPNNQFIITDEELVDLLSSQQGVKFLVSSIE